MKWNDFQTNVSKSFSSLRKNQDFFDVSLISDDEQTVPAHKVVLAASSEFFKNILRAVDHSKPVIYLSGINQRELTHIMEYIYEGELNIYQNELDAFLDVAQKLKIQGLVGSGPDLETTENHTKEENIGVETLDEASYNEIQDDHFINPHADTTIKSVQRDGKSRWNSVNTRTLSLPTLPRFSSSIYEEAKKAVDDIVMRTEDGWMCKTCNKTVKQSSQIRKHAETHIDGLSFPCQLCGESFRSRIQLGDHKRFQHRS